MFGHTIIESPFGSRDPLCPRIASLDEDSDVSFAKGEQPRYITHSSNTNNTFNQKNPVFEQTIDANLRSLLQDTSTAVSGCTNAPICTSIAFASSSAAFSFHPNAKGFDVAALDSKAVQLASSSTVPSPRHNAKQSDVAALDSKAVQPAIAPTHRKDALPRSVLASIMGNTDILDALMQNCPDFQTLLALVNSCKTAKRVFEQHPVGIIKEMLKIMPQELQDLTTALIGTNGCHIGSSRSITRHMEIWLGMRPKPLMGRLRVCTSELKTDT